MRSLFARAVPHGPPARRSHPLALVLALFVAIVAPGAARPAADRIHIVLLHTNDVHGQVLPRPGPRTPEGEAGSGGLARVAAYVESVRREHRGPGRATLLVDGGDWFQGTPEGSFDGGVPFVAAMTAIGYDAMVVGNHEWDLGEAPLRRILREARPPAVCANVRDAKTGERASHFAPWRIVEAAGVRIAFVGLVAEETPAITHPDARKFRFVAPVEEFATVLSELDGVDLVVPLTHCGVDADRALAEAFPALPLIVGGHSHTFLRRPVVVGETLIVQAGSRAAAVGRVDLFLERGTKRVVEARARLVELDREPAAAERVRALEARLEALVAAASREMDEVIGTLVATPRPAGPLTSTGLGNWITDVLRAETGADLAIHNKGGIRAALRPGPVRRRDVFEVMPFDNTVVVLRMDGATLLAAVRGAVEGEGRRGIEIGGARILLRMEESRSVLETVEVGGSAIDPARVYRVATNSFLATGGDRLFDVARVEIVEDTGRFVRDVLASDVRRRGEFRCPDEDRYVRVRGGRAR